MHTTSVWKRPAKNTSGSQIPFTRSSKACHSNSIPIVAMTANAFAEDRQKAISMGMNDHVAKPIDMNVLLPVIAKYIR